MLVAVPTLSAECRYPSLWTWLHTSLSAGLPRWSFLALFHFLFHLKLVCSKSAASYLSATAQLSARGQASLWPSVLILALVLHNSFLCNLDLFLKLFDIT